MINKYFPFPLLAIFLALLAPKVDAKSLGNSNDKWLNLLENTAQEQIATAPNKQLTMILHQVKYPSLAYLAQPRESLAGLEFYTSAASRPDLIQYSHISLLKKGKPRPIEIHPDAGVIIDHNWAPDSKSLALLIQTSDGITLWRYQIEQQELHQLSPLILSARLGGRHLRWLPDSSAIIVKTSSAANMAATAKVELLTPRIESSELQKTQGKTYKHLLNSPKKQQQFQTLTSSRLVKITLSGKSQFIGPENMIDHFAVSPDGQYLLVESLPPQLSAYLPYKKWGRSYQIIDLTSGKSTYSLPDLADKINLAKAKDSVALGARGVQWLPFKDSIISWVEAADNGIMATPQATHDNLYQLVSPFNGEKTRLFAIQWRYYDIFWSKSGTAILQDWRYLDKQSRTQLIKYQQTDLTRILSQRNYQDIYADKGDPLTLRTPEGNRILVENKQEFIYRASLGKSKSGAQPFIDVYSPYTKDIKRLFNSKPDGLDLPVTVEDDAIIIRRETATQAPRLIRLSGKELQHESLIYQSINQNELTYQPKIISYQRGDGLQLQGTLHLPNSYKLAEGKKIPAVLWIYPREFKDKKLGQQNSTVNNRFRAFNATGPLVALHDGFAVFESPSMPIMSQENGEPNDHFIEQLVMNAQAAVKALEQTGSIDVQRLAVMGHSYGAFAVANLLAHTDLFKAGIARSGAYNRTLTPFGFQGEERNLWQAKESYLAMSPFLYADQINEPLLLIHGENDLNPGTFPMQSRRMYRALVANDKTAKLVMLPYEGHGYNAKENLHQMLIQQSNWLKQWL